MRGPATVMSEMPPRTDTVVVAILTQLIGRTIGG